MTPADLPFDVRYYDPADCEVVLGGRLPHWVQAGAICFITWRTADSLPRPVLERLADERGAWLRAHGSEAEAAFREHCRVGVESALDRGAGSCPLRASDCSSVVADSLRYFDNDRYVLFDFVVMPNHVHVLAAFPDDRSMRKQCESWKHFTARALNRLLGRSGRFWQDDSFDHLVRSDAHFMHLQKYIADNPAVAGLLPGEFLHYSRHLAASEADAVHANPLAERADHIPESPR